MITIGITGTFGAGKGKVVEYLKTKGFEHYSVRQFLLDEINRRGIPPTRDNMHLVADEFRKNYSPGHIMSELLKKAQKHSGNRVIESIRSVGEIETLRTNEGHFHLLAITADIKVRYERIVKRGSSTDHISFEKFVEDEQSEMNNAEPWQMNLKACIAQADLTIGNNGTVEELNKKIDEILANIKAKNG